MEQNQITSPGNLLGVLDDGRVIEVKDMVAFIEHASNNW